MNVSNNAIPSVNSGQWHWFPLAFAALVVGVSSASLVLEADGHYSGFVGAALSIGSVPAIAGVIGIVFFVALLTTGFVVTTTDSRIAGILQRRVR